MTQPVATVVSQPFASSAGMDMIPSDVENGQLLKPRPQVGRWSDGICKCYKNIYPSCYCTTFACHGCWLVGMMQEKTKCCGGGWHKSIVGIYTFLLLLGFVLMFAKDTPSGHGHAGWIPWLFITIVAIGLRLHIVKQQHIREWSTDECLNNTGEICTGLWCSPCSICQVHT